MSDFFNDMPEEADEHGEELIKEQIAEVEAREYIEEESGEFSQVLTEILTEGEAEILSDAQMRLDQARLYEMLIKHNLFDGVHANKRAIQKVQDEAKNFFLERMEILLGMRQEKQEIQHVQVDSPFNDVEVQALKDIAAKLTKNASREADQQITPVQPPKQMGLKSVTLQQQRPQQTAPKPVVQGQPAKRPVPVQAPSRKVIPTPAVNAEGEKNITRDDIKKLTPTQLSELNKSVPRQKRGTSSKVQPFLDSDQKEMLYSKNQMQANTEGSAIAALLARTGKLGSGIETVDSGNDDGVDGRI